jgi:Family of unknown function (DUF6114)
VPHGTLPWPPLVSVTLPEAGHPFQRRGSLLQRGRAAFRAWRRSRPFWGGLFCILGGVIIAYGPTTGIKVLLIAGATVLVGILVGVLVALMGLFLWFAPQLRQLVGILAAIFSVASLITSDYGGFVIGMTFGIIGGSLGFAWSPVQPKNAS